MCEDKDLAGAEHAMPETNDEKNKFTDMGQDDAEQAIPETNNVILNA